MVQLSKRLQALADMVPAGKKVADVGCDHGFLDIYLVQTKKVPGTFAMDVRKGPLEAAYLHVKDAGLQDYIETRLSDGLANFTAGEAKTLVCAGMGGPLMQRILTDFPEKTAGFETMILQPQSELRDFRVFLRKGGYIVQEESIILEDGKYYFPMKVVKGREESDCVEDGIQEIFDRFGKLLIQRKEALLLQYLKEQKRILGEILEHLDEAGGTDSRRQTRLGEVKTELEYIHQAMELMK